MGLTLIRRYRKSEEHKEMLQNSPAPTPPPASKRVYPGSFTEAELQADDQPALHGKPTFDDIFDLVLGDIKAALGATRDHLAFFEHLVPSEEGLFNVSCPVFVWFYILVSLWRTVRLDRWRILEHDGDAMWSAIKWFIVDLLFWITMLRVAIGIGARIGGRFMEWEAIANVKMSRRNTNTVANRLELDAGLGVDCLDRLYERTLPETLI